MKEFVIDLGNGFVKAKSEKRTIVAPSSIAFYEDLGEGTLDDFSVERSYNVFESTIHDEVHYVWGTGIKDAVNHNKLLPTYTHNNRYSNKRFKCLFQFVLAELASDFEEKSLDVLLVTSLPSNEIGSEDEKKLREFLKRTHSVKRNDKNYTINVEIVKVNEQPLGTLLNIHMNETYQIHKDLQTKTIVVVDFGSGTTIVDTYKNMKRLPDSSITILEGQNDIYKEIANKIKKKYSVKDLSYTYVEDGFRDGSYTAKISERAIYPFENIAQLVIDRFCASIITRIDTTLTNRDAVDVFTLTGGGVNNVGDTFREELNEDVIQMPDGDTQTASLEGNWKFAKALSERLKKAKVGQE
ncbi:hypothetical protein [Halalkalibacter lacteus]|uniref:ParM/StbA family protein n=1 Tax=Halalkalibacter lacteus TaxID=3090663 RepID=UPI002FCB58FA